MLEFCIIYLNHDNHDSLPCWTGWDGSSNVVLLHIRVFNLHAAQRSATWADWALCTQMSSPFELTLPCSAFELHSISSFTPSLRAPQCLAFWLDRSSSTHFQFPWFSRFSSISFPEWKTALFDFAPLPQNPYWNSYLINRQFSFPKYL